MKLIVTEKPSVAKDIANVLNINTKGEGYYKNDNYYITWCIGHLIGLAQAAEYDDKYKRWNIADLPIMPEPFKLSVNESTKHQFENVKKLMNSKDVDEIICATDAGREGQLIFEYVYEAAQCNKPVKRLWISSMTDESILKGFNNLKDNKDFFNLYQAAKCRSEADWLVGINATRLFSVSFNRKLTVGRVQTPTLAMIVNRDKEIKGFVSELYYEVYADYNTFKAIWFNDDGSKIHSDSMAKDIVDRCFKQTSIISKIETKKASSERPLLYDLTELQRDGNRLFGYTAEESLNTAQGLYEKHKLISYPRTDSRYLTSDMKPLIPLLLSHIKSGNKTYANCIDRVIAQGLNIDKRIIDDSRVTDHHAIIVTNNIKYVNTENLTDIEKNILNLIISRLIIALDIRHEYEQTLVELNIGDDKFKAAGKKIIVQGWKLTEAELFGNKNENEYEMPLNIKVDEIIMPSNINVLNKKTSPPKPYTEATLLTAMEMAGKQIENEKLREEMKSIGLGTPATRAGIIEKLVAIDYIKRNKKNLIPTENGIQLIELVHEKLKKPDLTGDWEQNLNIIAEGIMPAEKFSENIKSYVKEIISIKPEGEKFADDKREIIGICPRCGKEIFEGKKNFYCIGYKDEVSCKFSLWKEDKFFLEKGKKLTASMVKKLLKHGKTKVNKLKSKTGKEYDAMVILNDTGSFIGYKLEFEQCLKK